MGKPIQIIPEGLLGMFQIKNAGKNPQELFETIQPSLEMLDWYMSSYAELQKGIQFAPSATGVAFFGIEVPPTEFWFVHSIGIRIALDAAEDIEARIGFVPPGGSFVQVFEGTQFGAVSYTVPNDNLCISAQPKTFFGPGTRFGLSILAITAAGGATTDSELWVTKFRR